jgi:CubicO group peptidase (beta-lactamase class C family)
MRLGLIVAGAAVLAPVHAEADCAAAIAYSDAHGGAAVLAIVDGRTTCRSPQGEESAYELASGTKSVVGLAAAAAVQDGLLTLDEKVSGTLTEWRDDPLKRDATVRQLLSMTAGLRSRIGRPPGYADAVAMPFTAAPGERFQYGPAPMQVFGELMDRKLRAKGLDANAQAYVERRIFAPIGFPLCRLAQGTGRPGAAAPGLVAARPNGRSSAGWCSMAGASGANRSWTPPPSPRCSAAPLPTRLMASPGGSPRDRQAPISSPAPSTSARMLPSCRGIWSQRPELGTSGCSLSRRAVWWSSVRRRSIASRSPAWSRLPPQQAAAPDRWSDSAFLKALFAPVAAGSRR